MSENNPHAAAFDCPAFGSSITLDVVAHSQTVEALQQAIAVSAKTPAPLAPHDYRHAYQFVEEALSRLLLNYCDFTACDFRLVKWEKEDRVPRAWGCYRLTHTPSGEWVEVVVSHVQTQPHASDQLMLLASMAIMLRGVMFQLPAQDWDIDIDIDISARPTEPGWPPALLDEPDVDWRCHDDELRSAAE